MKPFAEGPGYRLFHGDSAQVVNQLPPCSVDALVTDPPAGIAFMGKEWDEDKGGRDKWIKWFSGIMRQCWYALKPGGHGVVWALPRTSHWTATALENAGFEIRDVGVHINGQGFPKSLDISKALDEVAGVERKIVGPGQYADRGRRIDNNTYSKSTPSDQEMETVPATPLAQRWNGWGTALKPAAEHWILIRRPFDRPVAHNVKKWGVGGINIGACRIEAAPGDNVFGKNPHTSGGFGHAGAQVYGSSNGAPAYDPGKGRWPANLTLDEEAAALLDKQTGDLGKSTGGRSGKAGTSNSYGSFSASGSAPCDPGFGDSGGASRFFYTAKPSASEKGEFNAHPTVKAIALMRWLCRLVTPPGGLVLDPFAGSGTTGMAALLEGFTFMGVEQQEEYVKIATRRLTSPPVDKASSR